jgi:hypothetical protein
LKTEDYYITEKNGLMDDIYSKYILTLGSLEDQIKKSVRSFNKNLGQEIKNDWGEKRIKIKIRMIKDAISPDGGGKKTYYKNIFYKVGQRRAMLLVERGYAEIVINDWEKL